MIQTFTLSIFSDCIALFVSSLVEKTRKPLRKHVRAKYYEFKWMLSDNFQFIFFFLYLLKI